MTAVQAPPATTIGTAAGPRWEGACQEPVLASVWQAVASSAIGDELLEWPPDLFALTEVILQRSEAYRFALSPPAGSNWPPAEVPDWPDAVIGAARQWCAWVENRNGGIPRLLAQEWGIVRARAEIPLSQLAEARDWRVCEALLTLHAIADEACAGLGIARDASSADGCVYRARARELLARTGSLARVPAHLIRVLPKVHTPPNGSSVRTLSRYAAVTVPDVAARWHKAPARRPGSHPSGPGVNFLLLPWPLRIQESDFRPVTGPLQKLAGDRFGFFEFAPAERLDLDLVDRMLIAARDEGEPVDIVVLPESAAEHGEIDDLEALLGRHGVTGLITGVRERPEQPGAFARNWVHIGMCVGGQWLHIAQAKHHRWSLDDGQICQYHLSGALHPHIRWWEAAEIPRRSVQFVELRDEVTLASLVCEDLAQTDDVAGVIRAVGPMIVVTPLLDGPQLGSRWAARYAGVLADDPGSAVLTLTSFGMAHRSRPPGFGYSPVIALWKGPGQEAREIPLEPGAQGVLLSAHAARTAKRSYDGRRPLDNGSQFCDVTIHQIRASSTGSAHLDSHDRRSSQTAPSRAVLEADELTILTSWAEAAADALEFAPERIDAVPAAAEAGACWRSGLRIPEPSPSLDHAISSMTRAVRPVAAAGSGLSLDALLNGIGDSEPDEPALDRLVRAVLRYALEQRQARQAEKAGALAPLRSCRGEPPASARAPDSTNRHRVTQHRRELQYAGPATAHPGREAAPPGDLVRTTNAGTMSSTLRRRTTLATVRGREEQ